MSRPIILSLAITLCLSSVAHATPGVNDTKPPGQAFATPPADKPVKKRYNKWMHIVDGVSWGLLLLPSMTEQEALFPLMFAGVGGLVFGGAIVHAKHGQVGRAMGSFVMRVTIPTLAFFAGVAYLPAPDGDGFGELGTGILAGTIALATVQLVDAFVLAERNVYPGERGYSAARAPRWLPTLNVTSEVKTIGIGGRW